jgi:membrane protease YdiL (CAAX protease family)
VLGSIGAVLSAVREWRGSLVGPMVAHALNNATALTIALLLLM